TKAKTISVTTGSLPVGSYPLCDACLKKGVKPPDPAKPVDVPPRPAPSASPAPAPSSAPESPSPSPPTTAPRPEPEPAPLPPPPPRTQGRERHPVLVAAGITLLLALAFGAQARKGLLEQSVTTPTLPAILLFLFCSPIVWGLMWAKGMRLS